MSKLKKLKGLTMDEISVRVAQRVAILSERGGWSKHASLPSDDQLARLMQTRVEPQFFASFKSKDETVSEFRRLWPGAEQDIVNTADRISEGTFNLLGLRDL